MTFDRRASIRRIKPQRRTLPLVRRANADLPFVAEQSLVGRELLLDTCVYIDVLQGKTPPEVDRMLETRIVNHSTVALAELTHLIGALDPAYSETAVAFKTAWSNHRRYSTASSYRPINPGMRRGGNAGGASDAVERQVKKYVTSQRLNAVPPSSRDGVRFTHRPRFGFRFFRPNPPRYGGVALLSNLVFEIEFGGSLIDVTPHFSSIIILWTAAATFSIAGIKTLSRW